MEPDREELPQRVYLILDGTGCRAWGKDGWIEKDNTKQPIMFTSVEEAREHCKECGLSHWKIAMYELDIGAGGECGENSNA